MEDKSDQKVEPAVEKPSRRVRLIFCVVTELLAASTFVALVYVFFYWGRHPDNQVFGSQTPLVGKIAFLGFLLFWNWFLIRTFFRIPKEHNSDDTNPADV